jgi:hypothetical protein
MVLRFVSVFSSGYIHPDEFFQSHEVLAQDVFGTEAVRPWEFQIGARSIVLPAVLTGFPYQVLHFFCSNGLLELNGAYLLYLPRFLVLMLSLGCDLILQKICSKWQLDARAPLLVHSSSWVTLLFSSRLFSNSLEGILLCACFGIAILYDQKSPRYHPLPICPFVSISEQSLLFGTCCAVGFFNRFTFIFFVAPLCAWLLWKQPICIDTIGMQCSGVKSTGEKISGEKGSGKQCESECRTTSLPASIETQRQRMRKQWERLARKHWNCLVLIMEVLPVAAIVATICCTFDSWYFLRHRRRHACIFAGQCAQSRASSGGASGGAIGGASDGAIDDCSSCSAGNAVPWLVISPLVNLQYNLREDNLQSHGLHPR